MIGLALLGVGLAGCGQKGALYLPTDPAARNRATLPGLLVPGSGSAGDAESSAAPAAPAPAPTGESGAPTTREGSK